MSSKLWKPHPLYTAVAEILERKGPLTDIELYDLLRQSRGEVGFRNLNKTLMRMEIGGKIHVSSLTRGKRRVELIKGKAT